MSAAHTVAAGYLHWPREVTTDGASVHSVWRRTTDAIEVLGTADYDLGPNEFAYRVILTRDGEVLRGNLYLGEVEQDAMPRRLPEGAIVLAEADEHGALRAQLLSGHRQTDITWTEAISFMIPPTS